MATKKKVDKKQAPLKKGSKQAKLKTSFKKGSKQAKLKRPSKRPTSKIVASLLYLVGFIIIVWGLLDEVNLGMMSFGVLIALVALIIQLISKNLKKK